MADAVSKSPLIAFYRGASPDAAGRRIDDVWRWDDRRLEMVHDYIQWLFPLPDRSRFNPHAPCLTLAEAELFRTDADLQTRVAKSRDVMLRFYGLSQDGAVIRRGADFAARGAAWLTPLNHNHLRLTRMILSLGYVGRPADASALFACLKDIAAAEGRAAISASTLEFWRDAAQAPPPLRA